MRAEEVTSIIRVLTAAYPTYPFGDDTSALYVEMLINRDANVCLPAARRWITTQPHFPRINELVAAIGAEQRRQQPAATALPQAEERPRMTIEQIRAMRPTNVAPRGATHGHGTHRTRRTQADRP